MDTTQLAACEFTLSSDGKKFKVKPFKLKNIGQCVAWVRRQIVETEMQGAETLTDAALKKLINMI